MINKIVRLRDVNYVQNEVDPNVDKCQVCDLNPSGECSRNWGSFPNWKPCNNQQVAFSIALHSTAFDHIRVLTAKERKAYALPHMNFENICLDIISLWETQGFVLDQRHADIIIRKYNLQHNQFFNYVLALKIANNIKR